MSYFLMEGDLFKKYNGPSGHVVIPEGITKIDTFAFYNCTNITSVTIPNSLMDYPIINNGANFETFKAYRVRPDHPCYTTIDGLLLNKNGDILVKVPTGKDGTCKLPDCVRLIHRLAFSYCMVSEIIIPYGVEELDSLAFSNCSNLEKISLPDSIKKIDTLAFYKLPKLQSLVFPPEISRLSKNTVKQCESLRSIEFKSKNVVLEYEIFEELPNLSCITLSQDKDLSAQPYYKFPLAIGIIKKKYNGQQVDDNVWRSVTQYIHEVKNSQDWESIIPHNMFLIKFLFDENILTEEIMDNLIANSSNDTNTELTSVLIDIKESIYPSSQKFERMSARINQVIKDN